MKINFIILIALSLCLTTYVMHAQQPTIEAQGGMVTIPQKNGPCVSPSQRIAIQQMLDQNIASLQAQGKLMAQPGKGTHPLFDWPVQQANGFDYGSVWSITNYVDQNPAFPNEITDYNCGSRSYDTSSGYNHQGYDVVSWPFWWKQMDLDQAINIAAADGQIIGKTDGSFDRNCSFNGDQPNAIYLQHSDGSVTWYLHMKNGALTSKNIGDSVSQGEFLGVIGSSGSSTAPHLHFEVYDSGNNLIDPNIGPCNSLNSETWWNDQKPYLNPNVNAALTHSAPPIFPTCPDTEVTNESNNFSPGDTALFAIYLRDQAAGTAVDLKITRPDGSTFQDWDFNLTDNFQLSYWYWEFAVNMEGEWTWEATYNGTTTSHTFNVGTLGVEDQPLDEIVAYPNPTDGTVNFNLGNETSQTQITITNMLGQIVANEKFENTSTASLDFSGSSGLYFATISTAKGATKTIKILKK